MKIGSVLENQKIEKRISITPDIVKKYTSLGFEILLSENYGHHIGINNDEYKKLGHDQLFLSDPLKFSEILLENRIRQFEDADKLNFKNIFFDRGIPDI